MKPLEKTINECETRLDEVRKIVQTNLLSRYGQDELRAAIREAEGACDDVAAILVPAVNQDGYEKQLTFMVKLVQRATNSQASWEMWIPATEKADLEGWVKDVKPAKKKLEARRGTLSWHKVLQRRRKVHQWQWQQQQRTTRPLQ